MHVVARVLPNRVVYSEMFVILSLWIRMSRGRACGVFSCFYRAGSQSEAWEGYTEEEDLEELEMKGF